MTSEYRGSASEFIDHGSESYTFLADPVVDALVQVVVELGAQTWINRRRLRVMERVLAQHGLAGADAVETYVPTAEDEAAWRQERDRMMKSVYSALARAPAGGDAAAERAKGPQAPRRAPRTAPAPRGRARVVGSSGD